MGRINLNEEYRQALENLKTKRAIYDFADEEFEDVAYQDMRMAEDRVVAIIREERGVGN